MAWPHTNVRRDAAPRWPILLLALTSACAPQTAPPPNAPATSATSPARPETGSCAASRWVVVRDGIRFVAGESSLAPATAETLAALGAELATRDDVEVVRVEASRDCCAEPRGLSRRRAQAVASVLARAGLPRSTIAVSVGPSWDHECELDCEAIPLAAAVERRSARVLAAICLGNSPRKATKHRPYLSA